MKDNKKIFREENLKRASEAERLDDYIKVTSYKSWLIVLGGALIVAIIFIWSAIGKINVAVVGAGIVENGIMTCYFRAEDVEELEEGKIIHTESESFPIDKINTTLLAEYDVPYDVLFLSEESKWYKTVEADCSLEDGTYKVSVLLKIVSPIDFLTGGR